VGGKRCQLKRKNKGARALHWHLEQRKAMDGHAAKKLEKTGEGFPLVSNYILPLTGPERGLRKKGLQQKDQGGVVHHVTGVKVRLNIEFEAVPVGGMPKK